jgi:hypothetical protein
MAEFEIHLLIRPVPGKFETVFLRCTVSAAFLPRVGELVTISDGGWSEEVRRVWHDRGKRTVVEIGKPMGVEDGQGEDLVGIARRAGWS